MVKVAGKFAPVGKCFNGPAMAAALPKAPYAVALGEVPGPVVWSLTAMNCACEGRIHPNKTRDGIRMGRNGDLVLGKVHGACGFMGKFSVWPTLRSERKRVNLLVEL
jgi:hypothetical protein